MERLIFFARIRFSCSQKNLDDFGSGLWYDKAMETGEAQTADHLQKHDEKNVPCMMHNGSDSRPFWILRRRGGAQPMPPVPQNEPCRHQPEKTSRPQRTASAANLSYHLLSEKRCRDADSYSSPLMWLIAGSNPALRSLQDRQGVKLSGGSCGRER